MSTGIVCTIGPATLSEDGIKTLCAEGMTIARINMSHSSPEEGRGKIKMLKDIRERNGLDFKIMLDTKGPDIRIGKFENGSVELKAGQTFTFTTEQIAGNETCVYMNFDRLPKVVGPGQVMLLVDGMIRMTVEHVTDTTVVCRVDMGGELGDRKSLFVPGCELGLEFLSEADKADLRIAAEEGCDLVAASFVGSRKNVQEMTEWLGRCGRIIPIISKIESVTGMDNLDEIIAESEGIMVARGDLGVEYPVEQVPNLQKIIVKKCVAAKKFCIVATEMLESMITKPRPTRAEVTDIANAIWQGADAVMMSAETAVGKYPFLAIKFMRKTAEEASRG